MIALRAYIQGILSAISFNKKHLDIFHSKRCENKCMFLMHLEQQCSFYCPYCNNLGCKSRFLLGACSSLVGPAQYSSQYPSDPLLSTSNNLELSLASIRFCHQNFGQSDCISNTVKIRKSIFKTLAKNFQGYINFSMQAFKVFLVHGVQGDLEHPFQWKI